MREIEYSVPSAWYEGVYKDSTAPCNAGRSFSLVHKDSSDTAVLCVHGYTGYPGELVRPAYDLYEKGYDVFVPRLPGHGTSGKDFEKSRREDWIGVPMNAAKDLVKRYKNVYIVGHSMGGGISLIVASKVKEIKKVALVAPAVYAGEPLPVHPKLAIVISKVLKRFRHKWHSNPEYHLHYENAPADDRYLGHEYWSWVYVRAIYELHQLMREAASALSSLVMPVKVLKLSDDVILPNPDYTEYIKKHISSPCEIVEIENATHYVFYDINPKAEEKAVEEVLSFLS